MASFISETSNYLFVGIILFYVITNIIVFFFKNPEEHKHFYAFQFIIAILFLGASLNRALQVQVSMECKT